MVAVGEVHGLGAVDGVEHEAGVVAVEGEAVAVAAIGGELDFKRLRGADRFAANMILKAEREKDVYKTFSLDADKISDFVDKLKPQL